MFTPDLARHLDRKNDAACVLRGLDEFREHLGGQLTIMLLRGIGEPFDAHEIHRDLVMRSIEILKGLQAGPPSSRGHPMNTRLPLSAKELVDEYFIENRTRLLEIAAFLDRLDRADPGVRRRATSACRPSTRRSRTLGQPHDRLDRIQMLLSDPTTEPLAGARSQERHRRVRSAEQIRQRGAAMKYIDHHAHMVSRTTDDYAQLALTGCVAVTEPAFWAGWDRSTADRASRTTSASSPSSSRSAPRSIGIQHYTWLAMNPKESDDRELSREVLARASRSSSTVPPCSASARSG